MTLNTIFSVFYFLWVAHFLACVLRLCKLCNIPKTNTRYVWQAYMWGLKYMNMEYSVGFRFTNVKIMGNMPTTKAHSTGSEGIIIYKQTSHLSTIKTWPPIVLWLIHLKWLGLHRCRVIFKTNSDLKSIKKVTYKLHILLRLLCWMSERYAHMR